MRFRKQAASQFGGEGFDASQLPADCFQDEAKNALNLV